MKCKKKTHSLKVVCVTVYSSTASRSEVSDRDPLTPSVKPDSEPEQGNEIIEGKVRPQSCRVKL